MIEASEVIRWSSPYCKSIVVEGGFQVTRLFGGGDRGDVAVIPKRDPKGIQKGGFGV